VSEAGQANRWRDDDGREVKAWVDGGFAAEQARVFRRSRFSVDEAVAWRNAGVPDGVRAAQCTTAGVTPESVNRWRAAGIDATQAVHWHEMGFDLQAAPDARQRGLTPEAAFAEHHQAQAAVGYASPGLSGGDRADLMRRLLDAGVPTRVLHGYLAASWEPEDALPWAAAGLEAATAALWRMLGLTAQEAGRLVSKGADAVETVREWWRAGIPFDEVADWIGAGLCAQEAASQRAKGTTAEQAAALRALRDQEPDE
jgi:hypothetical protein